MFNPTISDSVYLGWSLKTCNSNKFPGDDDVAGIEGPFPEGVRSHVMSGVCVLESLCGQKLHGYYGYVLLLYLQLYAFGGLFAIAAIITLTNRRPNE